MSHNDRVLDRLHDAWLEPPDCSQEEEVTNVRMTIEIDFSYDGDMSDMGEVEETLETVLESGAESTCCELNLVRVIKTIKEV